MIFIFKIERKLNLTTQQSKDYYLRKNKNRELTYQNLSKKNGSKIFFGENFVNGCLKAKIRVLMLIIRKLTFF